MEECYNKNKFTGAKKLERIIKNIIQEHELLRICFFKTKLFQKT